MVPEWYHRDITEGLSGMDVEVVQRKLGTPITGTYNADTMARVRGLQRRKGLPMSGDVDQATAEELGERASGGEPPEWFSRDLHLWDQGEDVRALRKALGFTDNDDRYDPDTEAAVRRQQSANSLPLTGETDTQTVLSIK